MSSDKIYTSKLFFTSIIEGRTEWDEKYEFEKSYEFVQRFINSDIIDSESVRQKELHDNATKNPKEICIGFLVSILCDPPKALRHFSQLIFISEWTKFVVEALLNIINERYNRLLDVPRVQLLWLVRELLKKSVDNSKSENDPYSSEMMVWNLLRQIAGGDISSKNVWLAEQLVDILRDHRKWLDKFPRMIAPVVYTYLRIIEDHHGPQFVHLRRKEVEFVIKLLREKFNECMKIGRDLIRLLQNVARIPEFEAFWKDLLLNPGSLTNDPSFKVSGIIKLLEARTSRRFFVTRLTPEMERKIVFLCSDVKFGMHKRYQEWFQKQYLNTSESQTLICDLIRFIIGCIHPTNEVLGSDIIPRWAVIGWLLSSSTNQVATANAKLALFYDWLFYKKEADNIMNIEPGILVMHHSLRPLPQLTTSLLDFLCRIIPNFHQTLTENVKQGVHNSMSHILEKGVVGSFTPLFEFAEREPELNRLVKETFPDYCNSSFKHEDFVQPVKLDIPDDILSCVPSPLPLNNHIEDDIVEAEFSEEEEEHILPVVKKEPPEKVVNSVAVPETQELLSDPPPKPNGLSEHYNHLEKHLVDFLEDFAEQKNIVKKNSIVQEICNEIISEDLTDTECTHLAHALTHHLSSDLYRTEPLLPAKIDNENVEDSLNKPLFVLFKNLSSNEMSNHSRITFLSLLVELHKLAPPLGYQLLYFNKWLDLRNGITFKIKSEILNDNNGLLKTTRESRNEEEEPERFVLYRDLFRAKEQTERNLEFEEFLLNDIMILCENDPGLISWLVPDIYQSFSAETMGNCDLLQVIMERLDHTQVHHMICMVLRGSLQMFNNKSFPQILEKSLQWETVEQFFLWQLAHAHEIPIDCCLSVLPKLKFTSHTGVNSTHSEALSNILMMLRRESPSESLLRSLFLRDLRSSDFTVTTILQYWVQRYEDKMAKLINDIINTKPMPSPPKRKRNQNSSLSQLSNVSVEQILCHLNYLRKECCDQTKLFFKLKSMREALHDAKSLCNESQKKKYIDLLGDSSSSEEDDEVVELPRSKLSRSRIPDKKEDERKPTKSARGRKPKKRKKRESSGDDDSTEDEDLRKSARKRRKNAQVASDSD